MTKSAPEPKKKKLPKLRLEREVLTFLESHGFIWSDATSGEPSPIVLALKAQMKSKFAAFWRAWGRYQAGAMTPLAFYRRMPNARVMAIASSVQIEMTVAVYAAVASYLKSHHRLKPTSRILDAGTGAGFLPAWLAAKHSDVTWVGTDASEPLIRAAKTVKKGIGNLSFRVWDHHDVLPTRLGTFDTIISTLAVPLQDVRGEGYSTRRGDERDCPRFHYVRDQLAPVFAAWRQVAHDTTRLAVVLRLPFSIDMEAALVAAVSNGWTFDRTASTRVSAGHETIPLLVFHARLPTEEGRHEGAELDAPSPAPAIRRMYPSKARLVCDRTGWCRAEGFEVPRMLESLVRRGPLVPMRRVEVGWSEGFAHELENYRSGSIFAEVGTLAGRAYLLAMAPDGWRTLILAPDAKLDSVINRLLGEFNNGFLVAVVKSNGPIRSEG